METFLSPREVNKEQTKMKKNKKDVKTIEKKKRFERSSMQVEEAKYLKKHWKVRHGILCLPKFQLLLG